MTREEFLHNVTDFYALKEFCYDECCDACDDIVDDDSRDQQISEQVADDFRYHNWRDVQSFLYNLDDSHSDYWFYNDWGEWVRLDDDDFERYKNEVLEWADEHGVFEEEHGAAPADSAEPPEESEPERFADEDISVGDLFSSSGGVLEKARAAAREAEETERIRAAHDEAVKNDVLAAIAEEAARKEKEMESDWANFVEFALRKHEEASA